MRNKILLCGLIIVIMALIVILGYTNARYYFTASMTGDLDYVKNIGKISIYHPDWVGNYEGPDDGSGVFNIPEIPVNYQNIHYVVTNKINDLINEEEVEYWIRIVAEDGSTNMPITYDVHKYNTPDDIFNLEAGVGYGPFTLSANSEVTQQYSIRVTYNSMSSDYVSGIQHLKVQIIKKRNSGDLKVIDEAPLNMKYTGPKVTAYLNYYLFGTTGPLIASQKVPLENDNFTIDFKDSTQLDSLGIKIPDGDYTFHDVRHNINGANEYSGTATTVELPEGYKLEGYFIEVYLTSSTKVAVQLNYFDYTKYTTDGAGRRIYEEISNSRQVLTITKGTTINFEDITQIEDLGINLPAGYAFQGLSGVLVNNKYFDKYVKIPNTGDSHFVEVYMLPSGTAKANLYYYKNSVTPENLLNSQTLPNIPVGTVINFKDFNALTSLGIILPSGDYEFDKAYYSNSADTTGGDKITIPYDGADQTYNINVVFKELVTVITVPVKFYKKDSSSDASIYVSETTVNMRSDGTYNFTTDVCKTLCPALENWTSFTVYIANQWGSTYDNVGNTYENTNVVVDYNKTYTSWADFKLTDPGSFIYIKAWW